MKEVKNLWPENLLDENIHNTPTNILKQQTGYFNNMTKNVLVAEIVPRALIADYNKDADIPKMMHIFRITAPFVDNFYFDLAKIKYSEDFSYPLHIESSIASYHSESKNDLELEHALSQLFSTDKIVRIIQSLMVQSKSVAA